MVRALGRVRYVKLGYNKGVSARNDGMMRARGEYVIFIDDDSFIEPPEFPDLFASCFEADPALGVVTARPIDMRTRRTDRAIFPHTDKTRDPAQAFKTFRFQGTGVAMLRELRDTVGPLSEDIFYGMEEIEYAYRVIEAGYHILYFPSVRTWERNDPGGRPSRRRAEEMRLANKYIISFLYMPLVYLIPNLLLFTAYVVYLNRGRINCLASARTFVSWLLKKGRRRRRPIGARAQAYIRACGGQIWK
jgi:GT2 family glycosyltransferase